MSGGQSAESDACPHGVSHDRFCGKCMTDEQRRTKGATTCAACGRRVPPESDPRTVVFCSAACYGRDVAARGIVHIYRDLPPADGHGA